MQPTKRWIVVVLVTVIGLQITSCSSQATGTAFEAPSMIEPIDGTEFNRVILTEKAAERLGIETTPVQQQEIEGRQQKVIPYAAVIYGLNGETWAYINPEPLTYERVAITVDYIENDTAILSDGPDIGTEVVTVGVAELYGTDTGVGK